MVTYETGIRGSGSSPEETLTSWSECPLSGSESSSGLSLSMLSDHSLGASPEQSMGTFSIHFLWMLNLQSLHWRPCLKSPFNSFLQCWQTVGILYEWTTNEWGTRIRPANSRSTHAGRPITEEPDDRRSRLGDVDSNWSSQSNMSWYVMIRQKVIPTELSLETVFVRDAVRDAPLEVVRCKGSVGDADPDGQRWVEDLRRLWWLQLLGIL